MNALIKKEIKNSIHSGKVGNQTSFTKKFGGLDLINPKATIEIYKQE